MGKHTPQAPAAPDPTVMANAQADANIRTAQQQQQLNMINSTGPSGTVNYSADPSAPGGYRQTTTLSPGEQGLYDLGLQAQQGALGVANNQLQNVQGALNTPLTAPNLQMSGGQVPQLNGSLSTPTLNGQINAPTLNGSLSTPTLNGSFNQGQQVQGSIGPTDFTADRNAVTDAVYNQATSRLNPQWDRAQEQMDTRLANQGISQNNTAYANAEDQFGRNRNDAYNQALYSAVQQGANEQNTLFGQSLAQGQFANQAAGQQYAQGMGAADFANQAAQNQYGLNANTAQFGNQTALDQFNANLAQGNYANQTAQNQYALNANTAQFGNDAASQQYGMNLQGAQFGNQAQQQGFQNTAYAQNQPINQLSALLGMGQVSMPQGVQYSPTGVSPTDVMGAYGLNQQAQWNNYNAQMQNQQSTMGGLFNLGSAAIMAMSDVRLKRDIRFVGKLANGLNAFAFKYLWSPIEHVGVMAQDVLAVKPEAVVRGQGGYMAVNYAAL